MNPIVAFRQFLNIAAEILGPLPKNMFSRPAGVEGATKIAMCRSSDGGLAVGLLSPAAR
jgi:hypothetical protein